jgi:hypothetical protein
MQVLCGRLAMRESATGDGYGGTPFAENTVFYCEHCTAEDVVPPRVGRIVGSSTGTLVVEVQSC